MTLSEEGLKNVLGNVTRYVNNMADVKKMYGYVDCASERRAIHINIDYLLDHMQEILA
jgi:hypothetical protein